MFEKYSRNKKRAGFSLIEAILSLAVFMILATALAGALSYGRESPQIAGAHSRALLLAEEGLEATRHLRDGAYTNIPAGTHGLVSVGGVWTLSGASDTVGIFKRHLDITDLDANRKVVTSTIIYSTKAGVTSTVSLVTCLTNWHRRSGWGNWASSSLESSFNFTSANSGNATANGLSIAFTGNYVYLGRALSGGRELYIFDVSIPASPTLVGQADLSGNPNDLVVVGNYVYAASADNNGELAVINISNPASPVVNYIDLTNSNSGNESADALSISSDGGYLYLGRANNSGREFYIFDVSIPASPTLVGQLALKGNPNDLAVSGNYVYIASSDNSSELQVINIADKSAPILAGTLNLNSGNNAADGLSMVYSSSTVFLGRASSAAPEYYIINVSTPAAPSLSGTLEIGAKIDSLCYDPASNYSFLATASSGGAFKVVDNTIGAAPSILGQVNILVAPKELIYDSILDRVFIASTANTQELQIIKPQ
ncbi:MAG: prepilin-type N-terminal cleavage/methylation domain-containing protein [Patescibacteria group bacterium]